MKVFLILSLAALAFAHDDGTDHHHHGDHTHDGAAGDHDCDDHVHMSEKDFELRFREIFNDPEREAAAAAQLAKSEAEINAENAKYNAGEANFSEKLNSFSNLPKEEFELEKEGLITKEGRGLGLIMPSEDQWPIDPENEKRVEEALELMSRVEAPSRYNSQNYGYVTDARNQMSCGSCAAFAATAVHETCMIKAGAKKNGMDLSEQWLVDCGYDGDAMNACDGAYPASYTEFFANRKGGQAPHEVKYPYLNRNPKKRCPSSYSAPIWNSGAKVKYPIVDRRCNEDKMKGYVHQYGAVLTAIYASDTGFGNYNSGVFDKCSSTQINHAVTVVGYDASAYPPYWLVKNSWGNTWGDHGFIKIRMGTGECGIGGVCVTSTCQRISGATPAPVAPPPPPIPVKATCDMSRQYGSNLNGRYTFTFGSGANEIVSDCSCTRSQCKPYIAGPSNACMYICGKQNC